MLVEAKLHFLSWPLQVMYYIVMLQQTIRENTLISRLNCHRNLTRYWKHGFKLWISEPLHCSWVLWWRRLCLYNERKTHRRNTLVCPKTVVITKNKEIKNMDKHKILLIGDSHIKRCAAELRLILDQGYDVLGFLNLAPRRVISWKRPRMK
jgi:hypothetical protein